MRTGEWKLAGIVIEDLHPATLEGVAARLRETPNEFEELVYRETEIDALWSLTDLAIATMADRRNGRPSGEKPNDDDPKVANLVALRGLFDEAHELIATGRPGEAAEVISSAIRLTSE
jgi:hypothetical protein